LDVNKQEKVKVFVLTRYNTTRKQQEKALKEAIDKYGIDYPGLDIEFMTAHASKGLGADYVIVLDLNSKGFPSEKTNDPLLDLVLATEEDEFKETFPFAEERRLFYVAITRTKKRCYLIAKTPEVSCFINEIYADNDECSIEIIDDCKQNRLSANISDVKCPICEEAYMYQISEDVYKCSGHYCEAFIRICCSCGQGSIVPRPDGKYECDKCLYEPLLCKRCEGFMVYKKNQKTGADFLGCSRYIINDKKNCGYTISIPKGHYRNVLKMRNARLAQNKQNQITDQSSPLPF
jgi:DNA helicase-4